MPALAHAIDKAPRVGDVAVAVREEAVRLGP